MGAAPAVLAADLGIPDPVLPDLVPLDPARNSFEGRTALITGGSSGIGLELAKCFLLEGCEVVLAARDSSKLEKAADTLARTHGRRPSIIPCDLGSSDGPRRLFDEVSRKFKVDILVNNAGFGVYRPFHEVDLVKTMGMIDVNVKGLVTLTHLFLPRMIRESWGRVLNVASTAAFQAIPGESIYAATKGFVLLFSEGIACELKDTGVKVTCLCPGATDTPFFDHGDIHASRQMRRVMMKPADVAREGVDGLKRGKPLVIAGTLNKLLMAAERLAPRRLVTRLAGKMVE